MRLFVSIAPFLFPCFNPRICKRCDLFCISFVVTLPVSIHASVKDATLIYNMSIKLSIVSIHASVKDATMICPLQSQRQAVSIHASVKDATSRNLTYPCVTGFNPRICKRCDIIICLLILQGWFQSTHL